MATHGPSYGLSRELQMKVRKYFSFERLFLGLFLGPLQYKCNQKVIRYHVYVEPSSIQFTRSDWSIGLDSIMHWNPIWGTTVSNDERDGNRWSPKVWSAVVRVSEFCAYSNWTLIVTNILWLFYLVTPILCECPTHSKPSRNSIRLKVFADQWSRNVDNDRIISVKSVVTLWHLPRPSASSRSIAQITLASEYLRRCQLELKFISFAI